eukprot:scaffold13357_cov100-Isochrysis_galbana.AAC.1
MPRALSRSCVPGTPPYTLRSRAMGPLLHLGRGAHAGSPARWAATIGPAVLERDAFPRQRPLVNVPPAARTLADGVVGSVDPDAERLLTGAATRADHSLRKHQPRGRGRRAQVRFG